MFGKYTKQYLIHRINELNEWIQENDPYYQFYTPNEGMERQLMSVWAEHGEMIDSLKNDYGIDYYEM